MLFFKCGRKSSPAARAAAKNAHTLNNFFLRYPPRKKRGGYRVVTGVFRAVRRKKTGTRGEASRGRGGKGRGTGCKKRGGYRVVKGRFPRLAAGKGREERQEKTGRRDGESAAKEGQNAGRAARIVFANVCNFSVRERRFFCALRRRKQIGGIFLKKVWTAAREYAILIYVGGGTAAGGIMEKRIIAFDIGDKRIGIAASDPFNTFALPGTTYFRTKSAQTDAEKLAEIVREKDAGLIVCGLPLNFDGTESVQTEKTKKFVELLRTKTQVPIVFEDERFTTVEAERVLIEGGVRRENRKQSIDSIAASYILEGYLNKKKKGDQT